MSKKNAYGGYMGKFLKVDLSREKLSEVSFEEDTLETYIGGTGIGVKVLYDEVPPPIHWSDPSNRVILASGPLGGTTFPGTGTFSVVTKGALTGGYASCQANGLFGAYIKFSGYDGIIIQGVAKRWMYVNIKQDKAELKEASHLLGRDTYETDSKVKKELGKKDRDMSVVSIGPAGENLCRFAGTFERKGHSASHNGTGAVLGSKRLKAIAVSKGSKRVNVKYPGRLKVVADKARERALKFRGTIGGVYILHTIGTGGLPIKNYTTNMWDPTEEQIESFSEPSIRKRYSPKPNPCWACPATHSSMMTIPEGPYAGMKVEEPEYEQMAAMGPIIDNRHVDSAAMLSSTCDKLGFDVNEMGWILGWTMECYEKGLLTKKDLNGLEMTWGNVEAARQLMHMIAYRKGFGNLLAEGIKRASQKIGGEAAKTAIYTLKGNSPRGHDHRTLWGEMLDTIVSNTGTIETHTSLSEAPPYKASAGNPDGTSRGVALTKGILVWEDCLGNCRFNTGLDVMITSEATSAVTGWEISPEAAKVIGLRVINLMKVFNLRAGITKELDAPSERYSSTPVDGPMKGISIHPHFDSMLRNYYKLMGWDEETGKPLPETLKKLDLEHIIKDIW